MIFFNLYAFLLLTSTIVGFAYTNIMKVLKYDEAMSTSDSKCMGKGSRGGA